MRESKVEIGRDIAATKSEIKLQDLKKIQSSYNKFAQQKNLPKARVVGQELHLITVESVVKVLILDKAGGQFEVNNEDWQLSSSAEMTKDVEHIRKILSKGQILGIENVKEFGPMSFAVYHLGVIAAKTKSSRNGRSY